MPPTILVIDDFASVRLYHMSFLDRKGYNCLGAADGSEAIRIMEQQTIDVILLDLMMPGMNGDAFVAQISENPSWTRIPILVVTSERELAKAIFWGANRRIGVLEKPVTPGPLLASVKDLITGAFVANSAG